MKPLLLSVIFICLSVTVCAQDSEQLSESLQILTYFQHRAESVLPEFRRLTQTRLSPDELAIERAITYRVVPSNNIQAIAYRKGSMPYIDLFAGYVETIDWLASALLIQTKSPVCANAYISQMFDVIAQNSQAVQVHAPLTLLQEPFGFATTHPHLCPGISYDRIFGSSGPRLAKQTLIGASLGWVLWHELAHHLHGDVDKRYQTLSEDRAAEYKADQFAFEQLSGPDMDPLEAMPAYFLISMTGASSEYESLSDHPAGLRRFAILLQAFDTKTNTPEFQQFLRRSGKTAEWNAVMKSLHQALSQFGEQQR